MAFKRPSIPWFSVQTRVKRPFRGLTLAYLWPNCSVGYSEFSSRSDPCFPKMGALVYPPQALFIVPLKLALFWAKNFKGPPATLIWSHAHFCYGHFEGLWDPWQQQGKPKDLYAQGQGPLNLGSSTGYAGRLVSLPGTGCQKIFRKIILVCEPINDYYVVMYVQNPLFSPLSNNSFFLHYAYATCNWGLSLKP